MRIGFIGVGKMGAPMARNLVAKGFEVLVFDTNKEHVEAVTKHGATAATSIAELAGGVDTVLTMLPSGKEVRSIYLGDDGIIKVAAEGALLIDCSTIDVETARETAVTAKEHEFAFVDAPVSGGVAGAEAGSLTFMVGGVSADVERARPVLEAMGKTLIHVGPPGAGQAAKICNNLILGATMIGVCEAFVLAEHLGLAADKLFAVSANSSGQCWSLTSYCPVPGLVPSAPSNKDYVPGFSSRMMLKDLRLAVEAAEKANCHVVLAETAMRVYERFVQDGSGNMDFSAIINDLRRR